VRNGNRQEAEMAATAQGEGVTAGSIEHVDVLIAGAGISGIGGAYHLREQCPGKRFVVLEEQGGFGGTWITHRYPGIRSDSDLYTFGYRFKPWTGAPIATAEEILRYMGEVIEENDLARHIRYRHRITSARWSGTERRWTVQVQRTDCGESVVLTANFLWMCQGYYRHREGYTPQWPGMDEFTGRIVHPQTWPDDLDLTGKRVVVIGSGATAATLVPAIADKCAKLTMLQRSPTYFVTGRNANALADTLRELEVDPAWIHEIVRRKMLYDQALLSRRAFSEPEALANELLGVVRTHLGPEFDLDTHFKPRYQPWRQRIAFIPDGDLFKAIRGGQAAVVTDEIERFTAGGLALKSGAMIEADVIVTATGFHLSVLGDIDFSIDGRPLDFADTVTWRGAMFTGIPNMAWVFGYFRASWTLRADLIADLVCRLLKTMDERGARQVVPVLREDDRGMTLAPWVDPANFNPGYLARGLHLLPRQGDHAPWLHKQDYWSEKDELPAADLDDGSLVFF
jgi:cation diffusion facilitator CzcD-associated flavoprotein CzcO